MFIPRSFVLIGSQLISGSQNELMKLYVTISHYSFCIWPPYIRLVHTKVQFLCVYLTFVTRVTILFYLFSILQVFEDIKNINTRIDNPWAGSAYAQKRYLEL